MFRSHRNIFVVVVAFLAVFASRFSAAYTITPIDQAPYQLNNVGQGIAGASFWSGNVLVNTRPFLLEYAVDINGTGEVIGNTRLRPCTGSPTSSSGTNNVALLNTFSGGTSCLTADRYTAHYARAINNVHIGVGYLSDPTVGIYDRAESYGSYGGPVLPGLTPDSNTYPNDINDQNQAVGYEYIYDYANFVRAGPDRPILWQNGVAMDIGTLGGDNGYALKISNAGKILGRAQRSDGVYAYFIWDNGTKTDLGDFSARDMNSLGQVAGDLNGRAQSRDNGVFTDLNDLLPPGSGWVLTSASAINDIGQITGQGTLNGEPKAFLLSPDTAPVAHADLTVSITPDENPFSSTSVGFSFSAANNGPDNANGSILTLHVPNGVYCPFNCETPTITISQGQCHSVWLTGEIQVQDAAYWCELGDLAPGQNVTGRVTWVARQSTATLNTQLFSRSLDQVPTDNTNNLTVDVNYLAADLGLTLTDSPDPVAAGEPVTYTAVVRNFGPSDATNVLLRYTDIHQAIISITAGNGSCSVQSNTDGTKNVICALGNLSSGSSVTAQLTVRASDIYYYMSASVSSDTYDPNINSNYYTAYTTVLRRADLTLAMTDSPDPVLAGGTVTYTLTATNNGPSTATNVTATGTLPGCSFGTLTSGASASCTRTATASSVGTLTQSMSVSAAETDPNSGNNSATASTTVLSGADLAVTMTDTPDPVKKGAKLTYSIAVTNNGPQAASGVMLSDVLPSNVVFEKATTTQGTCSGTASVTCSLGSLASGAIANVQIVIKPMSTGTIGNSASVTGNEADPNGGNNNVTVNTTVTK